MVRNRQLYLLLLPVLAYFVVFHYWPMYGVQIAFKDFIGPLGIAGSPWVGFKHFERFFSSFHFVRLLRNTVTISLFALVVGFPVPIILALSMNEIRSRFFKKTVQNITYAPHFLSTVVMVGMIFVFLSPTRGFVNKIIEALGGESVSFMLKPGWFKSIYVLSGVWQNAGWGSVIYMAALAGIDAVGIGFDFFERIFNRLPAAERAVLGHIHFVPDLNNHSHARNVTRRLIERGWADVDIAKFLYGNWRRLILSAGWQG